MTKYREILRLKSLGFSERNIAQSCGVSRNANYAQTECQFRYCGTAIPFLTVRSTARLHHSVSRIFIPFISRRYV